LKPAQANSFTRPYLKKTLHKRGVVEWLKVKTLSSSLSSLSPAKVNMVPVLNTLIVQLGADHYEI
jgi:hypothetical protein